MEFLLGKEYLDDSTSQTQKSMSAEDTSLHPLDRNSVFSHSKGGSAQASSSKPGLNS